MSASTSPVVSVVIPAFNSADFIARTLDSVRAQTFDRYETIVVDDGSSDATVEVAAAYVARYGMAGRVLPRPHHGVAAARNAGMAAARAAYVALLDSDDLWYPDKLTAVMAEFDRHPEAELICHDEQVRRHGRLAGRSRRRLPRGSLHEALLFGGNLLSPSATVVRRDAALAIGGFDERPEYQTVEDYDFWLRFSERGTVRFLDRVLGEYVIHERSASRRIVKHHQALEHMLLNHLEASMRPDSGVVARLRARRRLARVYRSAVRQLLEYREGAVDQQRFVGRMLRMYPFELRNLAVTALWTIATLRRPVHRVLG